MKNLVIADLHLHSKYSRAVSQKMDLSEIAYWASRKGIDLVATADWTHPLWFQTLQNELEEKEEGLYQLKNSASLTNSNLRFVLSTEVSNIYTQGGQVRRIHTLIFSPNLSVCQKVISALTQRGVNLKSDGRPIMGLSMIELAQLLWEISEDIFILPAHVWTPWFSLYGSKSGFNSIDDCFGQYSKQITAVETGLSSDPIMNWSIPELETRQVVSFSDAHSGQKLGREATVFKIKKPGSQYSYHDLIGAFKQQKSANLEVAFTIEFFPEEGKYHYSGHRLCGVRLNPAEVKAANGLCPKCHKTLTIGVMDRVQELAKTLLNEKDLPTKFSNSGAKLIYPQSGHRPPFVSIVPLMEIIANSLKVSGISKKVQEKFHYLVDQIGPELEILLFKDLQTLRDLGEEEIGATINQMRQRQIILEPGYDGVFGKIEVNVQKNQAGAVSQNSLF